MSWLIAFLRTISLYKREKEDSHQSETSYHEVAADEKPLALIHAGRALADEVWRSLKILRRRCDGSRLSFARRPARWTFRLPVPSTCCSPARCECARVPVGIKETERWGEGRREREREERWGRGEIVGDDHGAANLCALWLNLSSIMFPSKWQFIVELHHFHSN